MSENNFKSGFVAIIGKPNVGKSTILNSLLKEKIAAVSKKPNTTRKRILGILSEDNFQIIFLDTPGIHLPKDKINKFMVGEAYGVLGDADLVCFVVEVNSKIDSQIETIIKHLKNFNGPTILVLNKIDLHDNKKIKNTKEKLNKLFTFNKTIMISAIQENGCGILKTAITEFLPDNPPYFPTDIISTAPEKFICSEFIREKIFLFTGEELPYSCALEILSFKRHENIVKISADINVERDSQKGMIIGKKGTMIKKIGSAARKDIEKFLSSKIFLDLNVRVQKNWSKDDKQLKRFGYSKET